MVCFRDFLLGSFAFEESVALDLLAEYGLTTLLLDFAMVSLCWLLWSVSVEGLVAMVSLCWSLGAMISSIIIMIVIMCSFMCHFSF